MAGELQQELRGLAVGEVEDSGMDMWEMGEEVGEVVVGETMGGGGEEVVVGEAIGEVEEEVAERRILTATRKVEEGKVEDTDLERLNTAVAYVVQVNIIT